MGGLRKGDTVVVLSGKDRGKTGKVLSVLPDRERALVERVNLLKHFDRRTQQNQAGGVIEREAPLHVAKLALMCPKCRKPYRAESHLPRTSSDGASLGRKPGDRF